MSSRLPFTVEKECPGTRARAARFRTLHGEIQTPIFMPVGTQATVKAQTVESLRAAGSRMLLANTYHLLLRPGPEVFRRFGGIHRFMQWDGPVLTDSGGFQIFSLPQNRSMREDGARFQSYVDGATHLLSPESSIAMQRDIGSDVMMALDQCIASTSSYVEAEAAMHLTHRWALRSLEARGDSPQALFGIVQGACHAELRRQSAGHLTRLPFDGFAIGGLAVGETAEERYRFTGLVTEYLPTSFPRYLMGVGSPIDILEAVHCGVDMFDCIMPSQVAQRGLAYTSRGRLQLRRAVYKFAEGPLDPACTCATCQTYSTAYLHHLTKADEVLGWHLISTHNFAFYHQLTAQMRAHIFAGTFVEFYERMRHELVRVDEENRPQPPKRTRKRAYPKKGDYEVHVSPGGFTSIRQISSGEVMHSVNSPDHEAETLYVTQSRLDHHLDRTNGRTNPWVIWDVGLGAAINAMAVIRCFEQKHGHESEETQPESMQVPKLRLVSFERDLDPLRLAVREARRFVHLRHPAPASLLEHGSWRHRSGLLEWVLLEGDFLERMSHAEQADFIYYDPFSYKTDTPLWTPETFRRIRAHAGDRPTELYTYSASTAVRVALLTAGFFVAEGVGTGPKATTTVAFSHEAGCRLHPASAALLNHTWLDRWRRSSSQFPRELPVAEREEFAQRLEGHPQFAMTPSVTRSLS